MAYKPLKERIGDLPLVICGPILRSVSPDSVTVWVALKEKKRVWIKVHEYKELSPFPNLKNTLTTVLEGDRTTIPVGEHLHVVAVTASLKNGNSPLTPEKLYFYNLFFTDADNPPLDVSLADVNLATLGIMAPINFPIHYEHEPENPDPEHVNHVHLPSFSLPPDDLDKLRIVHGSCRKPNAEELDAMPTIDKMITSDWKDPIARPHFLFLTGDQIYADDVSPIVLSMLMDASATLLGNDKIERFFEMDKTVKRKDDKIEIKESDKDRKYIKLENNKPTWNGKEPAPHLRGRTVFHFSGLSEKFKNHLMTFGEYCAMYLFVWSDVLWDKEPAQTEELPESVTLPKRTEVFKEYLEAASTDNTDPHFSDLDTLYKTEHKRLLKFASVLPKVRRALANVPTYMIFDDHEVTDDWHMTLDWCKNVFSNRLGKRIIQNGMLAYTLFQAWGNTPERFEDSAKNKSGSKILEIIQKWDKSNGYFVSKEEEIAGPLGLPLKISIEEKSLFKSITNYKNLMFNSLDDDELIEWNYSIIGSNFEILVLDGRTRRGYPDSKNESNRLDNLHASMIHESDFEKQLPSHQDNKDITFIVSPTSIVSIPAIELDEFPLLSRLVARAATKNDKTVDFYDHWKNQSKAFEALLSHIAKRGDNVNSKTETRNIVLTGDVHFSAASRLLYEKKPSSQSNDAPHCQSVFAQLVASSFKKQEKKTRLIHHQGYKFSDPSGFVQMKALLEDIPDKAGDFLYKRYIPALSETLLLFVYVLGFSFHVLFFVLEKIWRILDVIDPFDFFEPKLPKSRKFFGWKDPAAFGEQVSTLNIRIPTPNPNINRFESRVLTTPTILSRSEAKKVSNFELPEPHWRYRIDYILAENETRTVFADSPVDVTVPSVASKNKALEEYLKASKNHMDYARKHGSGKEIVGLNNVSEVSFNWKDGEKSVMQQTWWHLKRKDKKEPEQFFPLTKYKVSLEYNEGSLPRLD